MSDFQFTVRPLNFIENGMDVEHQFFIATDASTVRKNVGCGIAIVNKNEGSESIQTISYHTDKKDNNIGEAYAILLYLMHHDDPNSRVLIYVDSEIVLNRLYYLFTGVRTRCFTEISVELQKVINEIADIINKRTERITFEHVRSHQDFGGQIVPIGNFLNELADSAANEGRKEKCCVVSYMDQINGAFNNLKF